MKSFTFSQLACDERFERKGSDMKARLKGGVREIAMQMKKALEPYFKPKNSKSGAVRPTEMCAVSVQVR